MIIKELQAEEAVEEKIHREHGVTKGEVESALLQDDPKYYKARNGRYMAIGISQRFITIIFEYADGVATLVTSYPSSEWQIKLYHRK